MGGMVKRSTETVGEIVGSTTCVCVCVCVCVCCVCDVLVYVLVYQWCSNHWGSVSWCPHENLQSDIVSRACPNIPRSVFHTNLIALSCSARTDVLSCSQGTDGADGEILSCQKTSSVHSECFFLFCGGK